MISKYNNDVLKIDLTVISTMIFISHFLKIFLKNNDNKLFNSEWINISLATVMGYILHTLLFSKISSVIYNNLASDNIILIKSVHDIIKFSSIFTCTELILAIMNNKLPNFDSNWFMISGFTILGYVIFDIFNINVNICDKYDVIFNDILKLSFGQLISNYLLNQTITLDNLFLLFSNIIGITVYHLFIKKYVANSIYSGALSSLPADYLYEKSLMN